MKQQITIIAGNFHKCVDEMSQIASKVLMEKLGECDIQIINVPGAWEIPLAIQKATAKNPAAIITLGAIEKGHTGHGVAISRAVMPEIQKLSLENKLPISLGIIGPNATLEQIAERVESVATEAAKAVVHMLQLEV